MLISEPFNSKADCLIWIDTARQCAQDEDFYRRWNVPDNYRFHLYTDNGPLFGLSAYSSAVERYGVMRQILREIANAPFFDYTIASAA